jgi:chromate transporter
MIYWLLLYEFAKVGLFAVGGGLAAMPFLYDMADRYPWFNRETLIHMIAVSESTPGPIGVNMATYAGFTAAGIPGGVLATLALVLPSFIIMLFLVRMLERFKGNLYVQRAFYGLRPVVAALIASAGVGVAYITFTDTQQGIDFRQVLLFLALFAAVRLYKKMQPLYVIGLAGAAGVVLGL